MKKHLWEKSIKTVLKSVCSLNNEFLLLHLKMIIGLNITFSFKVVPSKALLLNCGSAREENLFHWGKAHYFVAFKTI